MYRLFKILRRFDYVLVFLLLVGISVLLIKENSYYQQSKIVNWCNRMAGGIYSISASAKEYVGLRHENEMLMAENAALRQQIASSYIHYDSKHFEYNDTVYQQIYHYITAHVIKNSWDKPRNYLMLNKGLRHGVRPDMAVISPQGLVGIITDASDNFSVVIPVLHPESRNSVMLKSTKSCGTLIWEGDNFCYGTVLDIPTTHPLKTGDTIVTSGQDPAFPVGIAAGYIDEVSNVPGSGFYHIRIRLATEFNKLEQVYIVHNSFAAEQEELDQRQEE